MKAPRSFRWRLWCVLAMLLGLLGAILLFVLWPAHMALWTVVDVVRRRRLARDGAPVLPPQPERGRAARVTRQARRATARRFAGLLLDPERQR
jgi:hypothetical protein